MTTPTKIESGFNLDEIFKNAERERLERERHPRQKAAPLAPEQPPTYFLENIIKTGTDIYLFMDHRETGEVIPAFEFTTTPLDNGANRTQEEWLHYKDKDGFVVPDMRVLYQIMRASYNLRNDIRAGKYATEITQAMRALLNKTLVMTLTKMSYKPGLVGIVTHAGPPSQTIIIPTFIPLYLAPTRPESELDILREIQYDAHPILTELLGGGWDIAPNVFQQFASRPDDEQLRTILLWTPTIQERKEYPERIVSLGISHTLTFGLYVGEVNHYKLPALGIRGARSPGGAA